MKRILCAILIFALLFLTGCNYKTKSKSPTSVKFYYLQSEIDYNTPNGVVSFETKQAGGLTPEELLQWYLQGPVNADLVSPFPAGLKLVSINLEDNEVRITVSKELTELTGIDLTLACSCLVKTTESILPAERYRISSSDGKLGGKSSIVITPDTFLWEDQIPKS